MDSAERQTLLILKSKFEKERDILIEPFNERIQAINLLLKSPTMKEVVEFKAARPKIESETWAEYVHYILEPLQTSKTNILNSIIISQNPSYTKENVRKLVVRALSDLQKQGKITVSSGKNKQEGNEYHIKNTFNKK